MIIIDKIVVAIIDSGIDTSKAHLYENVTREISYRINELGKVEEKEKIKVTHEHGTAISMIIKHIYPKVQFISINILNEELNSDGRLLIHALNKSIEYKPNIIHLSLGTTKLKYRFTLNKIIKQAEKEDIIVVSAANNSGKIAYPAHIRKVIGVKTSEFNSCKEFYYKRKFFYAPYSLKEIEEAEELKGNNMMGTSMAAAYITGHICKLINLNKQLSSKEIKKILDIKGKENYKLMESDLNGNTRN